MLKKIFFRLSSFFTAGAPSIVIVFIVGAVSTVIVMLFFRMSDSKAVIGFLGVIIGSGVLAFMSWLTARENRKQQWALAALDKRLEVHQEAYALWRRIVAEVHNEKNVEVVVEANKWWNNNCLYLDVASRQAFRDCLSFAWNHKDLLLMKPLDEETIKTTKESWDTIMKPGQTLPAGVGLPDLGEQELKS